MVSTNSNAGNSNAGKTRQKNSFKKLDDNVSRKAEDMSWLIDNLPVTVFRSSSKLSWGMDYVGSNVEKLTGYSKMDFIDQKLLWSDLVFPEDVSIVDKAVKAAKKNKSPYQIEYRIKRANGSTAFIQEQAHLVCEESGKLDYIAGVFSDLTSEVKQKADSHGSVKEDEKIQLEMFRSFVERISEGEELEPISGDFTGETKKTTELINRSVGNIMGVLGEIQTISKAGKEGQLSIRANDSKYPGGWGMLLRELNGALDSIISPLNVAGEYVERISRGDIPKPITDNYNGDFNEIKNNLNTCILAINNLVEDSLMLSEAGVEGRLKTRADATRHEGDFRKIVEGVNDTLNAVIGPLNVAAEYVERIGRGEIPEPITENYKGDFNEIKNNLNNCIDGLQGLVECNNILQLMAINDHTKCVEGEYVGIFASMGKSTNEILDRLLLVTNLINDIAVGDISQLAELKKTKKRSEHDRLRPAFISAMENIKLLIEDAELLSRAAVGGKLDTRADALRHQGEYRKIIEGVNYTLDAVISPLNVAAEYVERISRGEIPQPITENYNGDFNEIKNNINNCIDGMQGLVECNNILHRMAVNDQTKSVEGQYVGIYSSMAEATNLVRARVLNVTNVLENIAVGNTSRLEELKKIGRRSEQDRLMPSIIGAMENVHFLIEDTEMLSKAAVEGKLDTRADASKHQGEYRKIVQGVNDTLDAVIGPLNVAAEYVERISRGDIPEPITDNYNGDFNEIKNNLNTCIVAVNNLVEDAVMLSEAGIAGRLDTRADASRHQGDFRKVVAGVNDTLDAVIGPLNVAAEYVERISRGDIPKPITDSYNGDFNEIKNNLNTCIVAVNNLISDAQMLVDAAVEGKLDTRADASVHQGDFQKIVEGVNSTLDTLVGYIDRVPLPVMAIDKSFNILYMNETGSKLLDLTKRELIGKKCFTQFKTDDCQTQNCACTRAMERASETKSQTQAKPMGKELEISYTGIPIKNQKGEVTGAFEFVQDQTASIKLTNYLNSEIEKLGNNLDKLSNGNTDLHIEVSKADEYTIDAHRNFILINEKLTQVNSSIKNLVADAQMLSKAAVNGSLDTRADASKHPGDYRKIVEGVNDTLDAVIGPLNVAAEYVERISRGDIPEPITDNYNGDFNEIKNNLNTCIVAVNALVEDAVMLSEAGVAGRLDTRADASRHQGDFSKIVAGINDTLDAVIGPLNVSAEYVERISRGDVPQKITDNYNGDFNEIKNNLNNCIEGLQGLVECNNVLQRMAVNDNTKGVEGQYVGIYASMGKATNNVRDRILNVTNQLNNIAVGDTSPLEGLKKIGKRSEQDELLPAIIRAMENVNLLIEDTGMLSKAAVEGRLDTRADVSRHHGEYRKIIEGVNGTLDAVIGPLNVAAEYVERISRGDIPKPITDNYNGDFNEIKNNLNTCIVAVNALVEDALMLSEAGIAGQLSTRADATRHEGDFRKIVEGVNDTLDAVIGPLNVSAEYVERISRGDIPKPITDNYNGDFNEIKNNLNKCISAVNSLVADSLMLSEAGIAGQLETRADASRHQGDFRKIVVGVNDTLDAVIGPVNEAIRVSNEFSNGNFRARVDEKLHVEGDFINFKNVLNEIGISVSEVIISAKSVTLNVVDSSDEASKGADEVAKAAGNVAMSSQKTSELTRELLYKIEGINKEIVELSESNEKIASTSKGILSAADEVVRIGKDAQTLGRDTNLKMESVEKIARESVIGITSLTEQIKQIDGIVQLINDITSQINLLSLNAAIEAARAGEHGRGFAVVAGEVKNLATKARNATETIENVVMSVQRDSKKTADAINTANNEIIDGVNSVNKTLEALNTIIKNATQVTKDIGDITKAIEGQVNISMNVVTASEEGNAMTREVQREAEGLAATAQETSASVQEIGAAIHEMTDLSNKLKSEMEVFMV